MLVVVQYSANESLEIHDKKLEIVDIKTSLIGLPLIFAVPSSVYHSPHLSPSNRSNNQDVKMCLFHLFTY